MVAHPHCVLVQPCGQLELLPAGTSPNDALDQRMLYSLALGSRVLYWNACVQMASWQVNEFATRLVGHPVSGEVCVVDNASYSPAELMVWLKGLTSNLCRYQLSASTAAGGRTRSRSQGRESGARAAERVESDGQSQLGALLAALPAAPLCKTEADLPELVPAPATPEPMTAGAAPVSPKTPALHTPPFVLNSSASINHATPQAAAVSDAAASSSSMGASAVPTGALPSTSSTDLEPAAASSSFQPRRTARAAPHRASKAFSLHDAAEVAPDPRQALLWAIAGRATSLSWKQVGEGPAPDQRQQGNPALAASPVDPGSSSTVEPGSSSTSEPGSNSTSGATAGADAARPGQVATTGTGVQAQPPPVPLPHSACCEKPGVSSVADQAAQQPIAAAAAKVPPRHDPGHVQQQQREVEEEEPGRVEHLRLQTGLDLQQPHSTGQLLASLGHKQPGHHPHSSQVPHHKQQPQPPSPPACYGPEWDSLAPELLGQVVRCLAGDVTSAVAMSGVCRRWRQGLAAETDALRRLRVLPSRGGPLRNHGRQLPLHLLRNMACPPLPLLVRQAALANNVTAAVACARLLDAQRQHDDAMRYWRRAARLGDPAAQVRMGEAHYRGCHGVPRDVEEALAWLLRGAKALLALSNETLSSSSSSASIPPWAHAHDAIEAGSNAGDAAGTAACAAVDGGADGITDSSVDGHVSGSNGSWAANGSTMQTSTQVAGAQGSPQPNSLAAASRSLPPELASAGLLLGYIHLDGEFSVRQDLPEAVRWLKVAAKAGSREAEKVLGSLYNTGQYG